MRIYGTSRSRALRSLWAAEEMALEYEHVPTHFIGESKTPEYLKLNPNGRVPALVDGDLVLFESIAINLYLAERHGGDLWPDGDADRARTLQWSIWGLTELELHTIPILMHRAMLPEDQRDGSLANCHEQELQRPLKVLEDQLGKAPCLLGEAFSIADLNLAGVVSVAVLGQVALASFPKIATWIGACMSRPAAEKARSLP